VICCDAPISYTYPDHVRTIGGLARVAGRAIVVSVSSRLGYVPYAFNPWQKQKYFADPASATPDMPPYCGQRTYLLSSRTSVEPGVR